MKNKKLLIISAFMAVFLLVFFAVGMTGTLHKAKAKQHMGKIHKNYGIYDTINIDMCAGGLSSCAPQAFIFHPKVFSKDIFHPPC